MNAVVQDGQLVTVRMVRFERTLPGPIGRSRVLRELRARAEGHGSAADADASDSKGSKRRMIGWQSFLELLTALANGETPQPIQTVMERNRARYGARDIKR